MRAGIYGYAHIIRGAQKKKRQKAEAPPPNEADSERFQQPPFVVGHCQQRTNKTCVHTLRYVRLPFVLAAAVFCYIVHAACGKVNEYL